MNAEGFFEPRKISPTTLTIVIAIHAAALTALALSKTEIVRTARPPTWVKFIEQKKPDPPPEAKPVERSIEIPNGPTVIPPIVPEFTEVIPTTSGFPPVGPEPVGPVGPGTIDPPAPPPEPIRTEAQFDQRFAHLMQPSYPASEQRAERGGVVKLKVLVGADGKVKAVQLLSSVSTAFWEATQRHALRHWRFKPATVDGKPVESWKVMSVRFEMMA